MWYIKNLRDMAGRGLTGVESHTWGLGAQRWKVPETHSFRTAASDFLTKSKFSAQPWTEGFPTFTREHGGGHWWVWHNSCKEPPGSQLCPAFTRKCPSWTGLLSSCNLVLRIMEVLCKDCHCSPHSHIHMLPPTQSIPQEIASLSADKCFLSRLWTLRVAHHSSHLSLADRNFRADYPGYTRLWC